MGTRQGVFLYARCGTYILHYMIYILWLMYIIGAYGAADLSFHSKTASYLNKFMEHVSVPNR